MVILNFYKLGYYARFFSVLVEVCQAIRNVHNHFANTFVREQQILPIFT